MDFILILYEALKLTMAQNQKGKQESILFKVTVQEMSGIILLGGRQWEI